MTVIRCRAGSSHLQFDDDGFVVSTHFCAPVRVAWDEVKFVCPVPSLERTTDGWKEKLNPLLPAGFRSSLASSGMFELNLVLRDRRQIFARVSRWSRFWLEARLIIRPLHDADDKPMPDEALLRVNLYLAGLGGTLDHLFDLLARHCSFDLVCDF